MFTVKINPIMSNIEFGTIRSILKYQETLLKNYKLSDMLKALAFFMTKPHIAKVMGVSLSYIFRALNNAVSTNNKRYLLVMSHIHNIIISDNYDQYKYLTKGLTL